MGTRGRGSSGGNATDCGRMSYDRNGRLFTAAGGRQQFLFGHCPQPQPRHLSRVSGGQRDRGKSHAAEQTEIQDERRTGLRGGLRLD